MMENTKMEKIRKAAGTTAKVLKVLEIICIVVIVLLIVGGIGAMIIRDPSGLPGSLYIRDENSAVPKILNITDPNVSAGLTYIVKAATVAVMLAVVIILRKTFLDIEKSDSPFRPEILRRIRIAGILVTLMASNYSVAVCVMTGLASWCVYCIFDYGIELQKNEDETL